MSDATNEKKQANPAPLGLAGFGMTTVLLNIHNAGFFELNAMIMAMGIFYGGICQMIAGVLEFKRGNTFGGVAFTSYGAFWLTLVLIWNAPALGMPATSSTGMGWYLLMWGVFTYFNYLAIKEGPFIGKMIFGTLVVLFLLLAIANFAESHFFHVLAGYVGIVCGGSALYEAFALNINEKRGKMVFPL